MTTTMSIDPCISICPACSAKHFKSIELIDKSFGKRNNLLPGTASDISDDGIFQIQVCTACGFKMIANPFRASTSQLRALLLSHHIKQMEHCTQEDLNDMIIDLEPMLPKDLSGKLSGDTLEEQKLMFLYVLNDYLEDCKVEDLVDTYNALATEQLEEAFTPNAHGVEEPPKEQLKSEEVLADD